MSKGVWMGGEWQCAQRGVRGGPVLVSKYKGAVHTGAGGSGGLCVGDEVPGLPVRRRNPRGPRAVGSW